MDSLGKIGVVGPDPGGGKPRRVLISKEVDPVSREIVAFHAEWLRSVDRPVYLDGRLHPSPNAPHTWAGFSTGKWEGDMLTVTVTHLKEGYLRRNGLPRSDKATVREHWIRNGDFLTVMTVVTDPVYLTEPFVRTTDYELTVNQQIPPYPCGVVQEIDRPKDRQHGIARLSGARKAMVEAASAGSGGGDHQTLEGGATSLVLVEAVTHELTQEAPAL